MTATYLKLGKSQVNGFLLHLLNLASRAVMGGDDKTSIAKNYVGRVKKRKRH